MSNIHKAFENGKALAGFITGGDPSIEKSEEFILKIVEAGADLIEIGVPFSDPIAEGPAIQEANLRSLAAGTTTDRIFELVANVRKKTRVPVVLFAYMNQVFKYGYDRFFRQCRQVGVDGVVIPDLPYEEKGDVACAAETYQVDVLSLIAPAKEERIRKISEHAKGFLFTVTAKETGVTGQDFASVLQVARRHANVPVAVGGINDPALAARLSGLFDGIIVGSAIVKLCGQYGKEAGEPIFQYVQEMKAAIK